MQFNKIEQAGDNITRQPICNLRKSGLQNTNENTDNLQILNLYRRKLTSFPSKLNHYNIQILYLDYNKITVIPSSVANLINLKILYLAGNQIKKLPSSIGNLSNLEELYLNDNLLSSLPNTLNNLKMLSILYLQNNKLKKLPSLGSLSNIQEIYLDNNLIKILPADLRNLSSIKLISLNNNPLIERGNGKGLGVYEMMILFGNRISLNMVIMSNIDEKTVYDKLKQLKLYWNMDTLRQCGIDRDKHESYLECDLYKILDIFYSTTMISSVTYNTLRKYISKLNHPEIKYDGWAMYSEFSESINNIIGAILNNLKERMDIGDVQWIDFSLNTLCDSISNFCPDRQISEIRSIYHILTNINCSENNLSTFLRKVLATEKEKVFDQIFTPSHSSQNVHVLNYWKYILRDALGFNFDFDPRITIKNEDPFGGYSGNALDAFFIKFTPEYMIDILTELINNNKVMMCELMNIIASDGNLNKKDRMMMGLKDKYFRCDHITSRAVEYILIKENIVMKRRTYWKRIYWRLISIFRNL